MFCGIEHYELLSATKVYNGITSFSLGDCSGKAFLRKRHLRPALKDVLLTRLGGGHWEHTGHMVTLWQERTCCQQVGPEAVDQENMV